jgi:hypothetical protein
MGRAMGKVRTVRFERPAIALLFAAVAGCKGANADVSLSKTAGKPDETGIPNIPPPPADGPKLYATRAGVAVMDRPRKDGQMLGSLRVGAPVVRADKPYRTDESCPLGWYPIRPKGFVCSSDGATFGEPASAVGFDAALPLPHRYARVKSATPLYARIPTRDEQIENEPDLEKHLAKSKGDKPVTRAGANDVPLDESGVPTGVAVIKKTAPGVGDDGRRTEATYFAVPLAAPPTIAPDRLAGPLVSRPLRRGSALAVIGTFDAEGPEGMRRFGATTDGFIVPIDRLEPAMGSTFAGVDLTKDKTLPVGFVLRHEAAPYAMKRGKAERLEDDELDFRAALYLTGKFRTVDGVRYEEADDGRWLRDKDVIKIIKRSKFPDFVADGVRWVDVSLALQTMTLYEGRKPVYATLVSSGADVLGDPATSAATAQGVFKVTRKSLGAPLDPLETQNNFDVLDAPWQLDLAPGVAFVGSYWSDSFGEARSYHDIALSPIDAHRLFAWTGPEMPEGWSTTSVGEAETIIVNVRK